VTISTLLVIGALLLLKPTRQAVALVPYSTGLWFGQRGYTEWAETTWALTQRLTPDWPAPYLSLGNLYFRHGQLDQAKVELEQALTLTPDLAEAYNNLGLLYAARGDHTTAVEAFLQALALEPGQAIIEGNLAFSLQMTGQRDEALRHYALSRLLDAPQPVPLTNEAIAHYEAGNLAAAESAARQALNLGGASAPAYTVLGAVDLAQQRALEATSFLEEAIHLDPAYSPAHFYLGLAYKSLDRPALAAAAFERALALSPDPLTQHEARRHLSELHGRSGTDAGQYQPNSVSEGR
jgi:Flp pilus assembly protein TadD